MKHSMSSAIAAVALPVATTMLRSRTLATKMSARIKPAVVNSLTSGREAAASSHHDGAGTWRPGWGTRFLLWCVRCSERSRQRQALAELDDHFLKDIGVTRQQAIDEAAKPFWR